jgi:molybdopterin-biosynthesis enzyme MoeA-like protein
MKPTFAALIVGDEILSGKRADKHLSQLIALLGARGLDLAYANYVGDDPKRITATIAHMAASGDVVFSFGGIGATPDDHTRQCAGAALGLELTLHPQAKTLITQRMQETAAEKGEVFDAQHPDNIHRLNMGMFPTGAQLVPNSYNRIPGFSVQTTGAFGAMYFVPGFPVMAWPMVEWVLDTYYVPYFAVGAWQERSLVVYGAIEAALTPLMLQLEREHDSIKVFSLPSVDHPEHGRHVELGVKGPTQDVQAAFDAMKAALVGMAVDVGPELVR